MNDKIEISKEDFDLIHRKINLLQQLIIPTQTIFNHAKEIDDILDKYKEK
jgi:hypothetical protein